VKLSVLIPAYNEEKSVEAVVRRVAAVDVAGLGAPVELELIVVDDCSTDATTGILARLHGGPAEAPGEARPAGTGGGGGPPVGCPPPGAGAGAGLGGTLPGTGQGGAAVPGLRVLKHPHNRGKGAAIRTALAAATGDYVIIQDADFEYDPADVPRLLAPVLAGRARVVYGARPLDGSGRRWLLDAGNRALTVLTNLLYGTRLHDMETCYKLLPTALVRGFRLECSRFDLEPEITAKVTRSGERILEVPISYHPRAGGKKLSVRRDGLPALRALLRYRTWKPAAPSPG
jgi:glycosyltransferase involved in cell wall biosynthesis